MYPKHFFENAVRNRAMIYLLMVVLSIVILFFFVLSVLGYRIDFYNQTVEQGGLVQYDSFPRGAAVKVNDKRIGLTRTKSVLLPAEYNFKMQYDGYEDWQKKINIMADQITWLSYPRLIPKQKIINQTLTFDNLSSITSSPDGNYMAGIFYDKNFSKATDSAKKPLKDEKTIQPETAFLNLALIDFSNTKEPKTTNIPIDMAKILDLPAKTAVLNPQATIKEWSTANNYLLIEATYQDKDKKSHQEWLWLDINDTRNLIPLTKLTALEFKKIRLSSGRKVYVLQQNGDVRSVAVDDGTISRPLIRAVDDFMVYSSDTIAYTGTDNHKIVAGIYNSSFKKPVIIQSFDQSRRPKNLKIAVSNYFNQDTVTIAHDNYLTFYRAKLPSSDKVLPDFIGQAQTVALDMSPANLTINQSGRFVIIEDDKNMQTYDLERLVLTSKKNKLNPAPIQWFNQYHSWQIDDKNNLVIAEFDGENQHTLMPVEKNTSALLTKDGKYIYGFTKDKDKIILQQLNMIAQP